MILNLNGETNVAMLNSLIDFYNKPIKEGEHHIIYLQSIGGELGVANSIIDIINQNRNITTLKGYGFLHSSAFNIFFGVKCKTELIEGCIGMCHLTHIDINFNSNGAPNYHEGDAHLKYIKSVRRHTVAMCDYLQMTKKEKDDIFKRNRDVYFQPDRMLEFWAISQAK